MNDEKKYYSNGFDTFKIDIFPEIGMQMLLVTPANVNSCRRQKRDRGIIVAMIVNLEYEIIAYSFTNYP